ncbi:MAG: hypothetical protein ABH881_01140 [bacterium]
MMNLETITQPIEAGSQIDHERQLYRKINLIKLEFAQQRAGVERIDLMDGIKKHFGLIRYLEWNIRERLKTDDKEMINQKVKEILDKVKSICESNDPDKIENCIEEALGELAPAPEEKEREKKSELVYYGLTKGFPAQYGISEDVQKKYGIKDYDDCAEIHFEWFYKNNKGNIGKDVITKIKDDMSKIAIDIVDNNSQVNVVYGVSWIMGRPGMSRYGFEIQDEELSSDSDNAWLQFVDQHGNINKKRLQELAQKGELPIKNKLGIIPVEKFLKLYLPEERRRGKIILRDYNPEFVEYEKKAEEQFKIFEKNWSKIKPEEIDEIINSNQIMSEFLERMQIKDELIEVLKDIKIKGETFKGSKNEKLEWLKKRVKIIVDKDKFIERKIKL